MKIAGRLIAHDQPAYIIAEAGVNHNGDMDIAHRLIDAARDTGADAVKFQAFISEELVTPQAPKAGYQIETTGDGGQLAMLKALELSESQHAELKRHCESVGITYICTPYENASIDMLDRLGVAAYKIGSTDTTNPPFLARVAAKGRPVILSTGMSNLAEVEEAVEACAAIRDQLVLLHCTSEYPALVAGSNLRALATMRTAFALPVGFSDHTQGIETAAWAVIAGACVIEKHFTLDRSLPGPDHRASADPAQMTAMISNVRLAEQALGTGVKRVLPSEAVNKAKMQKSLVVRGAVGAGQPISADILVCKRPGTGLPPSWFDRVIGRRATRDLAPNTTLTLADLDWS